MNPYRLFLGDQRALDVIQVTAERLHRLASEIGPAGWDRSYAPGKWTARQIICHLADVEIGFGFRLRQAAAEDHHVVQPFDQEAWARPYEKLEATAAVEAFSALRKWNILFLGSLPPGTLQKPVTHPERGPMTMETIVETMGGHDRNHLEQLEVIRSNQLQSA